MRAVAVASAVFGTQSVREMAGASDPTDWISAFTEFCKPPPR